MPIGNYAPTSLHAGLLDVSTPHAAADIATGAITAAKIASSAVSSQNMIFNKGYKEQLFTVTGTSRDVANNLTVVANAENIKGQLISGYTSYTATAKGSIHSALNSISDITLRNDAGDARSGFGRGNNNLDAWTSSAGDTVTHIETHYTTDTVVIWKWVYDGTDVKFYIDGTLWATHNTHVPTAPMRLWIDAASATGTCSIEYAEVVV